MFKTFCIFVILWAMVAKRKMHYYLFPSCTKQVDAKIDNSIPLHTKFFCLPVSLPLLEASTCWLSFELLSGSFFVLPLWHKLRLTAGLDCGQLCSLALSVRLSSPVCLSGNVRLSGTVCHELKLNFLRNLAPAGEMTSAITSWVTDSQPQACISISLATSQFPKYMANMKIAHKVH